ncbi:MAG TPA: hypothetical protein VGF55_01810 [Gemmataceae bacterium]|jgi:hypothetical protein
MRHLPRTALVVAALAAAFAAPAVGRQSPKRSRFEYRTPAGVTYVVTPDGLAEVRLGSRVIARGGWRFRAADARWGFPAGPDTEAITAKSLEVVSRTEARVTHTHAKAVARHTFTFAGEDVRIESWVENHDPKAEVRVAAFEGPKVSFGRVPRGILHNVHPSYTAAHGVTFMHPGEVRIGGSYGVGDGFGVGAFPHDAGAHPAVILWDWDWEKRESDPNRTPVVYVNAPIPARGARTFGVTFRFSPNADWTHLLDPYRRHLHATVGDKLLYDRPSNRPLVSSFAHGAESERGPTNPYGYHPQRRLDTVNGVLAYHAALAPTMRAIQAQGVVIWSQGGTNPRGAMYRPDFDILPPEVVPNFVRLTELFRQDGMAVGVAARPGQIAQPLDWTKDTVSMLNAARPEELELLTHRFNVMIGRGCRLFYLDSFGARLDDVTIMRAVRGGCGKEKGIGPGIQTYVEHPSDVIIPYSGLLPVLTGGVPGAAGSPADDTIAIAFAGGFGLSPPDMPTIPEVLRYFYPDVPIVALVGQAQGLDTDARKRAAVEYCYKLRMTPMIPDDWLPPGLKAADWFNPLTRRYLTPDWQWKAKPD